MILLGRGLGKIFRAGNINPGPEGFETVASDLADEKYPRNIHSEPSTWKKNVEEQSLLKNKKNPKQMCRDLGSKGRKPCQRSSQG